MAANFGDYHWTAADIERLQEMWFKGMSAAECGKVFKVSRNSIIGRVHRSGWSNQRRAIGPSVPPQPREPLPKRTPVARMPKQPAKPFTLGVYDLQPGMCRWPSAGDVPPWTFCGKKQAEGSSYCPEHHRRGHYGGSSYVIERTLTEAPRGGSSGKPYHFGNRQGARR